MHFSRRAYTKDIVEQLRVTEPYSKNYNGLVIRLGI